MLQRGGDQPAEERVGVGRAGPQLRVRLRRDEERVDVPGQLHVLHQLAIRGESGEHQARLLQLLAVGVVDLEPVAVTLGDLRPTVVQVTDQSALTQVGRVQAEPHRAAHVAVAGDHVPRELPEQRATAAAGDGYEVTLDGSLTPGKAGELELAVARNGRPVTDLEPYLGAYGHLVALRAGDLAYLHVHPNEGEPGPVSFTATAPSKGSYRLFLDFKHDGEVRTAAFTVHAGSGTTGGSGGDGGADEGHGTEGDGGGAKDHGAGGDGGAGGGHGH